MKFKLLYSPILRHNFYFYPSDKIKITQDERGKISSSVRPECSKVNEMNLRTCRRVTEHKNIAKLFMLCIALCAGLLNAQESVFFMRELQQKIEELQLHDVRVTYEERAQCVGVMGVNREGRHVFYLTMKFIGSGSTFHWTPLMPVLLDLRCDRFKIENLDGHRVFLQWDSEAGFGSMSGYYIIFDRTRAVIMLRRIPFTELVVLVGPRNIADELND